MRHISVVNGPPTAAVPTEPAFAIDKTTGRVYAWSKTLAAWVSSGASGMSDGTVGGPGWAFSSDTDTGFYRVGANTLGVSAGGVAAGQFAAGQFGAPSGSVSAPGISFSADTNTGLRSVAGDTLGVVAGGLDVAEFTRWGLGITQPATDGNTGNVWALSLSGGAHTNLGPTASSGVYFALQQTVQFNATGGPTIANQSCILVSPSEYEGSGAPGVTITNAATLRIIGPPDQGPNMTLTNRWALEIDDGASLFDGPVHVSDGNAVSPAVVFNDDRNTGFYRATTDTIGFAVGGAEAATLSGSVFNLSTGYLEVGEVTPPGAPSTNRVRIYADESGGKTRIVARFATGAVQVIATEP